MRSRYVRQQKEVMVVNQILYVSATDLFDVQGDCGRYVVDKWSMLVLIFLFFYVVGYHSRLVEVTSRLDFLWKQQAAKELTDISETRTYNTQLLKNILPDHVATYFLAAESSERRADVNYSTFIDLICYMLHTTIFITIFFLGVIFSSKRWRWGDVCKVFNLKNPKKS
jgi:hypothetical protein